MEDKERDREAKRVKTQELLRDFPKLGGLLPNPPSQEGKELRYETFESVSYTHLTLPTKA